MNNIDNVIKKDKALIFRITHKENFPGILDNGVQCRSAVAKPGNYRSIGDPDLIDKRSRRQVPIPPGGTLSDYVPFYFTYASPMLYNIKTGYRVQHCPNAEIIFLVSSLYRLTDLGIRFVFTDRHAYLLTAEFSDNLASLDWIDWDILRRKDFKYDPEYPGKMDRYMAEALVFQSLPLTGLLGFSCYNEQVATELRQEIKNRGLDLQIYVRPYWYF
jgi:hypothetical protein